jgi:cytochrome c-type biogenesis protein CcmH/NrfG
MNAAQTVLIIGVLLALSLLLIVLRLLMHWLRVRLIEQRQRQQQQPKTVVAEFDSMTGILIPQGKNKAKHL